MALRCLTLFVVLLAAFALASNSTPVARAEATGSVAIGCESLAAYIDGDLDDVTFGGDFAAACDGLTEAELDLIDEVLGDQDEQIEPTDFTEIDLDDNQIQDDVTYPFFIASTYTIAFVSGDGVVTFDAWTGVTVSVVDDGVNLAGPDDGNPETCEADDDLDCDNSAPSTGDGDGVVVATITDGTADAGDTIQVDVSQVDVPASISSQIINVTGIANEITASVVGRFHVQTSLDAADCADESDVANAAQLTDTNKTLVRAIVIDSDNVELTRVPVSFEGDVVGKVVIGDDTGERASDPKATTGLTLKSGGATAAAAVVCAGEGTGVGTATALVDPNGVPGDSDDQSSSVFITVVGPPSAIALQATPAQFVCDGLNTATVTATVRDSDANLAADGTPVNFSVTSVGIVNPINTTTTTGIATTTFTGFSGFSVGVPVIVTSGNAQSSILIHCIGFDTDGDGMPNSFEVAHTCLNQAVADSNLDPDVDAVASLAEFQSGINPCDPDTDTDGCEDGAELAANEQSGGDRDPLDVWDFYDVTNDRAIDLADALAILDKFGLQPGQQGYDATFDRVAPDALKPWRTAPAAGANAGIDLQDALLNLQSFGHSCAS